MTNTAHTPTHMAADLPDAPDTFNARLIAGLGKITPCQQRRMNEEHDALTARVAELEAALRGLIDSAQPPALEAERIIRAPSRKALDEARATLAPLRAALAKS